MFAENHSTPVPELTIVDKSNELELLQTVFVEVDNVGATGDVVTVTVT